MGALTNFQVQLSRQGNRVTVECALDQGDEIDHDRTHDEEKTGDDDELLFDPHTPPNTLDTDW